MTAKKAKNLILKNARENNLKNLSLEIPHDVLAVVTGISGSGKSSLAFDTVFSEGQRRYIETFSPYTRQFFNKVKRSDLDLAENVRPAVAIQQKTRITNSRSTVGSITDINDYLKVLWSNIAVAFCPECNIQLKSYGPSSLALHAKRLSTIKEHSTFYICAERKVSGGKKGLLGETDSLKALGFSRFFNPESKKVARLEEGLPVISSDQTIVVVLDRFNHKSFDLKRVRDSLEQAFSLSEDACLLLEVKESISPLKKDFLTVVNNQNQANIPSFNNYSSYRYYKTLRCPYTDVTVEKPKPSLFSYNHPIGACPHCRGFGNILELDPHLCVPDERSSLKDHALQCWSGQAARAEHRKMLKYAESAGIDVKLPWKNLSAAQKAIIFENNTRDFRGVRPWFKRLERKAYKMHVRVFLSRYRSQVPCPLCKGSRLKQSALAYRVRGKSLPDIWKMPAEELLAWMEDTREFLERQKGLPRQLDEVMESIISRVRCLHELGLPYLTLDRQARTLSGGETQRVNLVTALGSELISTHFVLDEPSVGLHARDTEKLSHAIRELVTNGNSVLLVEHDPDLLYSGDYVFELGPDAGEKGGRVVYSGGIDKWKGLPDSKLPTRLLPTKTKGIPSLKIKNATARNLKGIDAEIPLNQLVCLTGVSGSGKSTLVSEVIQQSYERYCKEESDGTTNIVKGFEHIDKLFVVDQSSIARSPRANIATYTKIWDPIRELLSRTDGAITRAVSKSAFSFNVDGGRCPECKGAGFVKEDMQFLSDVYIPCELCGGRRFQPAVLEVTYRGKNVFEMLQMSVSQCGEFFHDNNKVTSAAATIQQLGLGHLTLGHPLSNLSGGEAQRLKLVPYVERGNSGKSLFVFDEPTTGLHPRDIDKLILLFLYLKDHGHSILCVEHNLTVIANSDYIIDLGPEGGTKGGELLDTGAPQSFLKQKKSSLSYTARYLKEYLKSGHKKKAVKSGKDIKKRAVEIEPGYLEITGAREHNLKDINVSIPLGKVVALTGVSGSGKSTIAKDIVYAEGQRRYLDCLSPYARQFIKELKRPEIDHIKNIQPTICVHQHTFQPSRLSTMATMSEVYNYLRLLYSKAGKQFCPDHPEQAITPQSAEQIATTISRSKQKDIRILAPVIKMKKGLHKAVFDRAMDSEIMEVRVDGHFSRPSQFEHGLEKNKAHTIEYTVARVNPARVDVEMLKDAIQQALSLGGGTLLVHSSSGEDIYSTSRTCPICKKGFFKPDPEDLSFNSKRGVCPVCKGSGKKSDTKICSECGGARINAVGRSLKMGGLNIHQASLLNASELQKFLRNLDIPARESALAEPIFKELEAKLSLLIKFGLDYIELNRDCSGLSSGELQRLRLAAAMGSPLSGVMYIFDEPSAGLHPLDNKKVLGEFADLRNKGNSVLLIEHDMESILSAEEVIEVGPGGGRKGGEITFSGSRKDFLSYADITQANFLPQIDKYSGNGQSTSKNSPVLEVKNANKNNLKSFDLKLPLKNLVCVSGVSGAGKTSLVHGVISDCLNLGKKSGGEWRLGTTSVKSSIEIARVLNVDQKPIGATARSTPASYLGIFDEIRRLFAKTTEARSRGWSAGHFSYNTGKGRCEECKGQGQRKLEMSFLADARVECEACFGRRYKDETEWVKYLGLSIADVLFLTFEEAKTIFANHKKVHQALHIACELGLGYLTIGQSSATLSGGESQRIKLVSELNSMRRGHTLYILDEPTTGLHRLDVFRLLKVLKDLVAADNTVVVIEHDPDLIKNSNYIVELGPGAGNQGGNVIFEGAPIALEKAGTPWGDILYKSEKKSRKRAGKAI